MPRPIVPPEKHNPVIGDAKISGLRGMGGEEGTNPWFLDLAARNPEYFIQSCKARFGFFESRDPQGLQAFL